LQPTCYPYDYSTVNEDGELLDGSSRIGNARTRLNSALLGLSASTFRPSADQRESSRMKQRQLHALARQHLDDCLLPLDFAASSGTYHRELRSRVIQIILIGLDARTNDTFQVLCGLNARLVSGEADPKSMGVFGGQHLTPHGWDCNSGRWPCENEKVACESFQRIRVLVKDQIEPWFRNRDSLSTLADSMNIDQHGLHMAALYRAENHLDRAVQSLHDYRERLCHPKPWDDSAELDEQLGEVDRLLQELAT
jgi:hypothetical protein